MANQNCRQSESEIRAESPQMADTTNQFGNLQFLVVRNLDDLELAKKLIPRHSGKERYRAVRLCGANENPDSPRGTCISNSYFLPELKNIQANVFTVSRRAKIKGEDTEDCENTQSSQVSLSTAVGDLSEMDSSGTFKDGRQQFFRRSSRTTVHSGQMDEDDQKQRVQETETRVNPKEQCTLSTESCIHLYKRIEALEDLLRRGLDTFGKQNCNCKEKSKIKKHGQQNKVTFLASDKSKEQLDGLLVASETPVTKEEKENRNIENELRQIKSRVTALEEKMKRMNLLIFQSDLNSRPPSKSIISLKKKRSHRQMASEKQNECSEQVHSGTESLRQSEIFVVNAGESESVEWKTKNKARTRALLSRGKKRVIATYKKVGKKSSCLLTTPNKKSSHSRNDVVAAGSCRSEHSTHRTRSLDSTVYSISRRSVSERNKRATAVIYLKCQHASLAWPSMKTAEKKKRKPTHLCRKIPVTNFVISPYVEQEDKADDPRVLGDCKFPTSSGKSGNSKRESKGQGRSKHSPTGGHGSHRRHTRFAVSKRCSRHCPPARTESTTQKNNAHEDLRKEKSLVKARTILTPKETVKEEGKGKIPLIFKDICKPFEPFRKFSNISMKVVFVEKDREKSLKKLLEKLTDERQQNTSEQHLPVVRNCSCEEVCLSENSPAGSLFLAVNKLHE